MSTDPTHDFAAQLREDVHDFASANGDTSDNGLEASFASVVSADLTEYGEVADVEVCILDEKTTRGIVHCSGHSYDEDSDRLDLLVALYRDDVTPSNLTRTEIQQAFERATRLLQLVREGRDLGNPDDSDQAAMLRVVRDRSSAVQSVRVIIISNRRAKDAEELTADVGGTPATGVIWDLTRYERMKASGRSYESIQIDLSHLPGGGLPCLPMPERDCGYRTFLALIPGETLYELYDQYSARLLQLNVRSFLQARGKVNRGIRDTIVNEPHRFLAYNNGLTATVESLSHNIGHGGVPVITSLTGFQVVNGGQTVASIHAARRKDNANVGEVLVQAKISVVDEELMADLVPAISRYANTQNRISDADFSSNDPFHVKLEELSYRIWAPGEQSKWFYERARGQYQVAKAMEGTTPAKTKKFTEDTPTTQKFTKTDLAKYQHTWNQLPHIVSRGAQKNFVAFMDGVGKKGLKEPDEAWYRQAIATAILFKRAEKIARELKITPYRANVLAYTVALLSYKTQRRIDLARIWDDQDVGASIESTLTEWMPTVHTLLATTARGRNVTEWCKKEECWRELQSHPEAPSVPSGLERELADGAPLPTVGADARKGRADLSPEDHANIAKTMMLKDTDWLAVHRWGRASGRLGYKLSGIAHTLVEYAAGGWSRVPSAKQAKAAVGAIDLARGNVPELDEITGL